MKCLTGSEFIDRSALAAAVTVLVTLGASAQPDHPAECRVGGFYAGPQAWTFNRFTFFEAVDKAKAAGCRLLEAYPGQTLRPDRPDLKFGHEASPSVWAQAKLKLESTGVRLSAYGVVGIANNEAAARRVFDFAKLMDIPIINTEPAADAFGLIDRLVKEYDIKVGIHNHPRKPDDPGYKYWDPEYILDCVKDLDPRIGSCADTGHWIRSGVHPLEALRVLEGRVVSSHLKDLNQFTREGIDVPFGMGIGDLESVLDELRRQRFDGALSIEYEHKMENNLPEVKQCVEFLREYGETSF